MTEELKACPVCGGKPRLIKAENDKRRQTNKIECMNKPCIEITRAAMFGVDDIIKIWNTRTDINTEMLEALKFGVKILENNVKNCTDTGTAYALELLLNNYFKPAIKKAGGRVE